MIYVPLSILFPVIICPTSNVNDPVTVVPEPSATFCSRDMVNALSPRTAVIVVPGRIFVPDIV